MMNNPSSRSNERKCHYCGAEKTYVAVAKEGTPYAKWNSNPYKEDTWICGKCYRNLLYHKALPPIHVRRSIRIERVAKQICNNCGGKTTTQKSKTSIHDYHIWHKHPTVIGKWLCGKCFANRINEPKKKFKTREERCRYLSELFTGVAMARNKDDNLKEILEIITKNSKRLYRLTEGVLDVTRIDSKILKLNKESIDIFSVIEAVVIDYRNDFS